MSKPPKKNTPPSAAGLRNLNRKGRIKGSRNTPKPYPSAWEDFLLEYKFRNGLRRACVKCKISPATAYRILRDPRTPKVMEDMDKEIRKKKISQVVKEFVLEVADVDEAMFDILCNSGTHDYKGDEPRVNAGIALYKRLKMIEPPRIVNNNSAQSAALAGEAPKQLPHLFQSAWRKAVVEAQSFGPEHQLETGVGSSEPSPGQLPRE